MNFKKKYFIGLSECELHIYGGYGSDPFVKDNLGLSGMWCSRGKRVQLGLRVEGEVGGEKEGPLSFRVEQMRPESHRSDDG